MAVSAVGAALRVYTVGDRPVVHATPVEEKPPGASGKVLAPWPNRVADGRWEWQGEQQQLAISEPKTGNAIHGLVRWAPFVPVRHDDHRLELQAFVPQQTGWPGPVLVEASYELSDSGLTATVTGTNVGAVPLPFGAGAHPYLATPGGLAAARIRFSAGTYLEVDDRGLPVADHPVAGSPYDCSAGETVGDRVLDTAYTDLERADDGTVSVVVEAADGCQTTLWGDDSVRWVQVFTADTLPGHWRRASLAVEPVTCPPGALNSGRDLVTLQPEESSTMTWGLRLA